MEQRLRSWLRVCIPFGIYVSGTHGNGTHTPEDATRTRFYYLQHCYIFLLYCTICILYIHGIYVRTYLPGWELSLITLVILFTSRYVANVLIFMEAVWRKCEHDAFLKLLEALEQSLRVQLNCNVKSAKLLKQTKRFAMCQLLLSVVGMLPLILSSLWIYQVHAFFWHGLWFIFTMRIRGLQLLVYLRILQHYMACLYEKLQQIVAYRLAPTRELLAMDCGRLGSLEYLLAVREISLQFYAAFHLLNEFAGWSLFGIVISSMFDLGANLYWVLQSLDKKNLSHIYFTDFWWFIPVTAFVWCLCEVCDKCKQLALKIKYLLHKITIASTLHPLAHYRLALQQFSTQLQLQPIEVTARNFFVLDISFIMSVCAATAMLLVILLQF